MSYREADIAYENGRAWVLKDAKGARYTAFLAGDLYTVRFYSSRGIVFNLPRGLGWSMDT